MYIPRVRERVKIKCRHSVFVVLSVDPENQRVDVVSLASAAFPEESVSLAMIRPYREAMASAAHKASRPRPSK